MTKEIEEKLWRVIFLVLEEEYPFSDTVAKIVWRERQSEVMRHACAIDKDRVMVYFEERLRAISEIIRARNFKEARELQKIAFQLTVSVTPT